MLLFIFQIFLGVSVKTLTFLQHLYTNFSLHTALNTFRVVHISLLKKN
jgi:hypothetical protein